MIELPRACFLADTIAAHADFFSFGTNDLTQTALGFSRDDIEGKILAPYIEGKIFDRSPFETLDTPGVGQLVRMGAWLGTQGEAVAEARRLRRARRRPGLDRLLPQLGPGLRVLLAVPRAGGTRGGGSGRDPPRRRRRLVSGMRAAHARVRAGLGAGVTACMAALVLCGVAHAEVKGAATITFPPAMTVGDTGRPAVLTVANTNDEADDGRTNTVCNAGDPSPCVAGERGLTLIPSCKQLLAGLCSPAGADPGVFALSATGAGRAGSRCAGLVFDIAVSDPVTGAVRFTVSGAPGAHVTLQPTAPLSFCLIDFTIDVLKAPAGDSNPALAGVQTAQVTQHTQHANGTGAPVAAAVNTTTITRAAPTIASTASPSVNLGGGQITDAAVVSGRVTPVEGATIDFRLYDPDDVTCAGAPVFESLGVPYPAGGGAVTSAPFTPTKVGTYRWIAAYSGDANNLPVSGTCDAAGESVLVNPPAPGAFTNLPPGRRWNVGLLLRPAGDDHRHRAEDHQRDAGRRRDHRRPRRRDDQRARRQRPHLRRPRQRQGQRRQRQRQDPRRGR